MRLSSLRFTASILVLMALSACAAHYTAPVEQIGGAPRFLDDGRQHRVNGGETLYAIAWMYDLDVNALARANNLPQPYTVTPGTMLTVDPRVVNGGAPAPVIAGGSSPPVGSAVVTAIPSIGGLQRTPLPSTPLPNSTPSTTTPATTTPSAPSVSPSTLPPSTGTMPQPAPDPAPTVATLPPATTTPPVATPPAVAPSSPATLPPAATIPEPTNVPLNPAVVNWAWPHNGTIVARFSDTSVDGKGVDLSGNAGDPVLAAADGEVVYAGGGLQRYGNLLILKHNDHFLSAYAHNRSLLVKEGERVRRGQKIAELGSSGIDRNMLHFEIRQDGKPVDPLLFLPSR